MKKTITALFLLTLIGCGQQLEESPAPAGACSWTGSTGLCVAPDPDVTLALPPIHFELWYEQTRQCAAGFLDSAAVLDISGPVIRVTSAPFAAGSGGELQTGWTNFESGQITIAATPNGLVNLFVAQHEYLHYLMLRAGRDPTHGNPIFSSDCDPTRTQ